MNAVIDENLYKNLIWQNELKNTRKSMRFPIWIYYVVEELED